MIDPQELPLTVSGPVAVSDIPDEHALASSTMPFRHVVASMGEHASMAYLEEGVHLMHTVHLQVPVSSCA